MDWASIGFDVASVALSVAGFGVPAILAGAAAHFIKNKAVADVVGQAAGVAYTHIAASFAKDGHVDFGAAKEAAVAAGVTAVQGSLNKVLPNNDEAVAKVTGALGHLLASDPNFRVTNPTDAMSPSWFVPVPSPGEHADTATQGGGS